MITGNALSQNIHLNRVNDDRFNVEAMKISDNNVKNFVVKCGQGDNLMEVGVNSKKPMMIQ